MRYDGVSGTKVVNPVVQPPIPCAVRLNASSISGTSGTTRQLTATAYDHVHRVYAGATITWTSSNTAVATVNASGLVTFGSTKGTAIITAAVTTTRAACDCKAVSQ